MLKFSPDKLKTRKKSQQDCNLLIITPIKGKKLELKLPSLNKNFRSPRRIPKECQFLDQSKVFQVSKTPLPCYKSVKYSISKDLLLKAMNKVQHVTLVKNLTEHRSKKEEFRVGVGEESLMRQRAEKDKGEKRVLQPTEEIFQGYLSGGKGKPCHRKKSLDLDMIFGV